jgi:hypothetical protein
MVGFIVVFKQTACNFLTTHNSQHASIEGGFHDLCDVEK